MPETPTIPQKEELAITIRARIRGKAASDAKQLARATEKVTRVVMSSTESSGKYVPGFARGNSTVIPASSRMQRSTVMARYSGNRLRGSWRAHGNYLAREHAQNIDKKGVGFDYHSDDIAMGNKLESWQNSGDKLLWKIVVSPEFGELLDLREHTRVLVRLMEVDLHTKLEWVAIDHYNTDNPHVHLLVRGIDDSGKPLIIDKGYIQEGLRLRSGEVATNQLGPRSEDYAARARARQIGSNRFTDMDRRIIKQSIVTESGITFALDSKIPADSYQRIERQQQVRRMKKLESLQLATYRGDLCWRLPPDIKMKLQELGEAEGQMKMLDRHRAKLTDKEQPLLRTAFTAEGERLVGIILGSGIDPETDHPYLMLEATDGNAHFLLQSGKIQAARLYDHITDGTVIAIEARRATTIQAGIERSFLYHHVEGYGKVKNALQHKALIDQAIFQQLPKLERKNTGFAAKFHEVCAERIREFEQHGIFIHQENWQPAYTTFRAIELAGELALPDVSIWKPMPYGGLIGTVIHSESQLTVIKDITGKCVILPATLIAPERLQVGTVVLVQRGKGSGDMYAYKITPSALSDSPPTQFNLADRMLVCLKGKLPSGIEMPDVRALLGERITLWKSRNINPETGYFMKKAKDWLEPSIHTMER